MRDFPRLVLDANIMISALIGRSFPLLINLVENEVLLFAAAHQLAETRHRVSALSKMPGDWVDAQMRRLNEVVIALHPALLDKHREVATSRLGPRGEPDWPILAACYETRGAAWSHDKDLFGSGVAVWSTRVLLRQIGLEFPVR
ncbi:MULTISPECIES: PIN domain-containing protein [unclassified Sphingomonas]|uniref:PIN domain-containing protein n=1 Tax=unclassified Sphingomonas TaxID=196159 RepID=UPI00083594CC|nr:MULTISPECIES: PIN domain-containing protein [unclassified Sphingomonas]